MKAEINNGTRILFESLYIYQNVYRGSKTPNKYGILTPRLLDRPQSKYDWLELKPLSQISDEDAVEVSGFDSSINWNNGLEKQIWKNTFGFTVVSNGTGLIHKYGQFVIWERNLSHVQFDYLRSKGYALPWMDLSVEEMIEAGWIKLNNI